MTGILWEPQFLEHQTGEGHPERPARLTAIWEMLQADPVLMKSLQRIHPRPATTEEIALVHDRAHIDHVAQTSGRPAIFFDMDTPASAHSWEAAQLAVGAVLTAVDELVAGRQKNIFAFVRPPGHHAERARAMGFCLFNNVAIAAEYAIQKHHLKKVLIVDYDVHHGNGTQHTFYNRPDVFYVSTHRYPFYPGTGAADEEGMGAGKGYTLNIPFSGGQGDEELGKAFETRIIPVARDYAPDLVIVSAGFDAHRLDPLGGMEVTDAGFAQISKLLLDVAGRSCGGKILFVLEGGYSLQGLQDSIRAVLQGMISFP